MEYIEIFKITYMDQLILMFYIQTFIWLDSLRCLCQKLILVDQMIGWLGFNIAFTHIRAVWVGTIMVTSVT